MITQNIYNCFVQLRKQHYKLKTWKGGVKYSKLELNTNKYKTIKRFCNAVEEMNHQYGFEWTAQEMYDELMDRTKHAKSLVIF